MVMEKRSFYLTVEIDFATFLISSKLNSAIFYKLQFCYQLLLYALLSIHLYLNNIRV